MTPDYTPPVIPELDGTRFESINCTNASLVAADEFASNGLRRLTVAQTRAASGDPTGTGSIHTSKTYFDSLAPAYAKLGLRLQPMDTHTGTPGKPSFSIFRPIAEAIAADKAGHLVFAIGQYSVVNDWDKAHGTRFSGDPAYRGPHVITIDGGKVRDPLRDRRRPGIPGGRCVWPAKLLEQFFAAFSRNGGGAPLVGPGLGVFGVVKRAVPIVVSLPPPPPEPPLLFWTDEQYQSVVDERDAAYDALAALRALIADDLAEADSIIDGVLPAGNTGSADVVIKPGVTAKEQP